MIDWPYLAVHFLWILGLSAIVAAFSYHDWLRREARRPLARQLREPSMRLALNGGLALVAIAIAIMPRSERWWTRSIALVAGLLFAWAEFRVRRRDR